MLEQGFEIVKIFINSNTKSINGSCNSRSVITLDSSLTIVVEAVLFCKEKGWWVITVKVNNEWNL